jgi:hypothetical protein
MKSSDPHDPTSTPETTTAPLTDLVDDKLNKPLADEIAEELVKKGDEHARSGVSDYAHGTAEHEDEREA